MVTFHSFSSLTPAKKQTILKTHAPSLRFGMEEADHIAPDSFSYTAMLLDTEDTWMGDGKSDVFSSSNLDESALPHTQDHEKNFKTSPYNQTEYVTPKDTYRGFHHFGESTDYQHEFSFDLSDQAPSLSPFVDNEAQGAFQPDGAGSPAKRRKPQTNQPNQQKRTKKATVGEGAEGSSPLEERAYVPGERGKISKELRDQIIIPYCAKNPSGPGKKYTHAEVARTLTAMPEVQALLPVGAKIEEVDITNIRKRHLNEGEFLEYRARTAEITETKISSKLRDQIVIPYCKQYPSGPGELCTHEDVAQELNKRPDVIKLLPEGTTLNGLDIHHIYRAYLGASARPSEDFVSRIHKKGDPKISEELREQVIIPYCKKHPAGPGQPLSYGEVARSLMKNPKVKALLPVGAELRRDDIGLIYKNYVNAAEQSSQVPGARKSGDKKISVTLREQHIIPYCKTHPSGPGNPYKHAKVARALNDMPEVQALLPPGSKLTGPDISYIYTQYVENAEAIE